MVAATAAALFLPSRTKTDSVSGGTEFNRASPLDLQFTDANGQAHSLADLRGRSLVVNFWATWCAPCRKEMPTLDRLQGRLGGPDFQVVTLSLDRGSPERVSRFLTEIGNANLTVYLVDPMAARTSLGVFGLPTTLLVDREGNEIDRVVGPAEWDAPEKIALIRERLGLSATPVKWSAEFGAGSPTDRTQGSEAVCKLGSGPGRSTCPLPAEGASP